jgi:hypothetical protein
MLWGVVHKQCSWQKHAAVGKGIADKGGLAAGLLGLASLGHVYVTAISCYSSILCMQTAAVALLSFQHAAAAAGSDSGAVGVCVAQ